MASEAPKEPANQPPIPKVDPPLRYPPKPSGMKVEKPNFIIFMPDQLRYDSLGCTGNKVILPNHHLPFFPLPAWTPKKNLI